MSASSPVARRALTATTAAVACLCLMALCVGLRRSPLNWDVALFLQQAQLIILGRVPFRDFWDINPPLIMFLNLPPVLLAKGSGLPIALAFHGCVLFLLLASLLLVRASGWGRESSRYFPVAAALALGSLHALLIGEFGQREHLFAISFVPYFLARWSGEPEREGGSIAAVFGCALFACLKPVFFILLLASELILCRCGRAPRKRVVAALLLPASAYLFLFLLLPLAATKNFWLEHVPFLLGRYGAFDETWWQLYLSWRAYFFLVPWLGLCLALNGRKGSTEKKMLSALAALISLAFLLALLAKKNWAYHLLVVDTLCCLGIALLATLVRPAGAHKLPKAALVFLPLAALYSSSEMSYFGVPATIRFARQAYKEKLIALLRSAAPGEQVVIFAAEPFSIYPELLNHGLWPGTRYPILYPLAFFNGTAARRELLRTRYPAPSDLEPAERIFVERVREDLVKNKPALLVFRKRFTPYLPNDFNSFEYAKSVGWIGPLRGCYRIAVDDSEFLVWKLDPRAPAVPPP